MTGKHTLFSYKINGLGLKVGQNTKKRTSENIQEDKLTDSNEMERGMGSNG